MTAFIWKEVKTFKKQQQQTGSYPVQHNTTQHVNKTPNGWCVCIYINVDISLNFHGFVRLNTNESRKPGDPGRKEGRKEGRNPPGNHSTLNPGGDTATTHARTEQK